MKLKLKLITLATAALLSTSTYATDPDTQVVEYYHPLLKHYFITASATDTRLVDSGGAGEGWVRTGRTFGAWSSRDAAPANATSVRRFYSEGANSHVYVASDADISLLQGLEARERASNVGTAKRFLGWGDEGEAFLTVLPKNGQCPTGTDAITRIYNDRNASSEGSNHRYVSDDSLTLSMADRKWQAEGVVFCSPASTASASANVLAKGGSAAVAGSYSGNALFKFEEACKPEVKVRNDLSLTLAADGALTGAGGGCKFTGTIAAKNASASLRGGSLSATACTDARFNGSYARVEIEQFSAKSIDIRFKLGDNAREASIEGVLNNANATPTPTPTPTPIPSNGAAVAGDFSGILAVMISERPAGQPEKIVLNVNQPVSLKVSSTGAVSGSVQGCTISGTITPAVNNRFTGTIIVTGCTEIRLNGTYAVGVHLEDGGAIEVELEREVELGGLRIKVKIEGDLARSAPVTTPPTPLPPAPPVAGIAIAGSFAGNAGFVATRRPADGKEVTVVDKTQALTLTISSTGKVTGSGGGCSFSGNLASSSTVAGVFTGTIVADGCTDAIISGSFAATANREDANGLEVEHEREAETSAERVKVKIKARLNKQ